MRYVALLRGINVGGNTMVKMEELRKTFEGLGFENVKTYINSGNIAFDARKVAEAKLVKQIETALEAMAGKAVRVMVREQSAIADVIARNPYHGKFASHKEMHVLFLPEELPEGGPEQLSAAALDGESYAVMGREIYAHLPGGVADSLLTKMFLEKKLNAYYTARNWRTVEKLAEL